MKHSLDKSYLYCYKMKHVDLIYNKWRILCEHHHVEKQVTMNGWLK
jgi:hypothetical protein